MRITPIMSMQMTIIRKSPQCSRRMMCEKIMTKIGEQKIIVAASPTGNRANPINMHVTVKQPTIPEKNWISDSFAHLRDTLN